MIPGAMLALILAGRTSPGIWVALLAVGFGFGGEETYGQTVGLSYPLETRWWALLGFAIKGAMWGLLGGAFAGFARIGSAERQRFGLGLVILIAAVELGWRFINHPKLIYFSNRLDRPREELWAALILGGLGILAWMRMPIAWRWAGWGALGGGIGFALGAAIQAFGRTLSGNPTFDWWKVMEFTFGFCLGAALAHARPNIEPDPPAIRRHLHWLIGLFLAASSLVVYEALPLRYSFVVVGAALALAAIRSEAIGWQIGITITYAAFAYDLFERLKDPVWWIWVIGSSAVVAYLTEFWMRPDARRALLFLMWAGVGHAFFKGSSAFVLTAFFAMAVALTLYTRRNEFVSADRVVQDGA